MVKVKTKSKTCKMKNLKQVTPTKEEIFFVKQNYPDLMNLKGLRFGGNVPANAPANAPAIGTLRSKIPEFLVKTVNKFGIQRAATVLNSVLPTNVIKKIIDVGKHEEKLMNAKYSGGNLENGSDNKRSDDGKSDDKRSDDKRSDDKRSDDKRSDDKRSDHDHEDEDVYVGDKNEKNERHGNGKMTYADGDVYEGEWKNNKKSGNGKMTFKNNSSYDGKWRSDNINGFGVYKYYNGDVYEGLFVDGNRNGEGKMSYENGDKYIGIWKNNKRHGKGKQTNKDQYVFEGRWVNDKKEGNGKLTTPTGQVTEDVWQDDVTSSEQINKVFESVNKVFDTNVSPILNKASQSQYQINQLTFTCGAVSTLITAIGTIFSSFKSLISGDASSTTTVPPTTAYPTTGTGFSSIPGAPGDTSYLYWLLAAGGVSLSYYIYLRMFGNTDENRLLDDTIKRNRKKKSKLSSHTRKSK